MQLYGLDGKEPSHANRRSRHRDGPTPGDNLGIGMGSGRALYGPEVGFQGPRDEGGVGRDGLAGTGDMNVHSLALSFPVIVFLFFGSRCRVLDFGSRWDRTKVSYSVLDFGSL